MSLFQLNKVSIVCPFFNEEAILNGALEGMVKNLSNFPYSWELIIVNDGSIDQSSNVARTFIEKKSLSSKIQLIEYQKNMGRGYALRVGIAHATGDIIVTTEIDLSWGDNIILDITQKFKAEPWLDAVVASPNLPGGGYKNVPPKRVLISKVGNKIIRLLFTREITMNTGMTRGYKKEIIQSLNFEENGKEFHLEAILKLKVLGYAIGQVPAILEWKDYKLIQDTTKKRKSSTDIKKIAFSHLSFAIFANPIRYLWSFAIIALIISLITFVYAVYCFITGKIAIFFALVSLLMGLFSVFFFAFGVITSQNVRLLKESWRGQQSLNILKLRK